MIPSRTKTCRWPRQTNHLVSLQQLSEVTDFSSATCREGRWQIAVSWPPYPTQENKALRSLATPYMKTFYWPNFVIEPDSPTFYLSCLIKTFLKLNTIPFLNKVLINAVFFTVLLFLGYFSISSRWVPWAPAGQSSCYSCSGTTGGRLGSVSSLTILCQLPIENPFSGLAYIHLIKKYKQRYIYIFNFEIVRMLMWSTWQSGGCVLFCVLISNRQMAVALGQEWALLSKLAKMTWCLGHLTGPVPTHASSPKQG